MDIPERLLSNDLLRSRNKLQMFVYLMAKADHNGNVKMKDVDIAAGIDRSVDYVNAILDCMHGMVERKENVIKITVLKENIEEYMQEFDLARKIYPGVKRGVKTEFEHLKKKHKDWRQVIPIMKDAILNQISYRAAEEKKNKFVPPWKHFQTWLNQRCWEDEVGQTKKTMFYK